MNIQISHKNAQIVIQDDYNPNSHIVRLRHEEWEVDLAEIRRRLKFKLDNVDSLRDAKGYLLCPLNGRLYIIATAN